MLKTAVVGASGYIGRFLWQSYLQEFPDCVGTSFSKVGIHLTPFDLRKPDLAALQLEETGHQAVLIASAKSNVDYCERESKAADAVNVAGTLELVRQLGRTSLSLIFMSSDYVFKGTTGRYEDDAPTEPTTEYGRQKVRVEEMIPTLIQNWLILRLSKVYGLQKMDGTLLDEMGNALAAGREMPFAADQYFCPTYVADVVKAIHMLQERGLRGVMNLCSPEIWSRHDIAAALARMMNADPSLVKKIALHDLPSMKGRPLNSTMLCSRLIRETDMEFMPFREAIERTAANWRAS